MDILLTYEDQPVLIATAKDEVSPVEVTFLHEGFKELLGGWLEDQEYIVMHSEADGGYAGVTNGLDDLRAFEQRLFMLTRMLGEGWDYRLELDGRVAKLLAGQRESRVT